MPDTQEVGNNLSRQCDISVSCILWVITKTIVSESDLKALAAN